MSRLTIQLSLLTVCAAAVVSPVDARHDMGHRGLLSKYASQYKPLAEADRLELRQQIDLAFERLEWDIDSLEPTEQLIWQNLLHLEKLHELLDDDSIDVAALRAVERSFFGLTHGLDADSITELRQTLTNYIDFLIAYTDDDLRSEFENRLEALDAALSGEDGPDAFEIGRHVKWLIGAKQVPDLVAEIQSEFANPNIVIDVNPLLFLPYMGDYQQEINQSKFTTNTIVGVPVSGMSHFSARVRPTMREDPNRATVRLELEGMIESPENDSHPDPQSVPVLGDIFVALKTTGRTRVTGFKDIFWNGAFLVADSAEVECETQASLDDVAIARNYMFPASNLARNIDEKIRELAHKEMQKNSPQANRQSAAIAEEQVREQLDLEVQKLLDKANEDIYRYYRAPLISLGLFPVGTSKSDRTSIQFGFQGQNGGGIGAPHPPINRRLDGDLELTMHETMCSAIWAGYLEGRTITDSNFRNIHRELRGFVPMELRLSDVQTWSVTLRNENPLETRFRHGCAVVTFHIDQVAVDGQNYQYPVSISACYRVEPEIVMPRFIRDGEIEISFRDSDSSYVSRDSGVIELLQRKFNAFFAPELHMDGLSAPVGNEWGTAAKLNVIRSDMQDGWWRIVFKQRQLNRLN